MPYIISTIGIVIVAISITIHKFIALKGSLFVSLEKPMHTDKFYMEPLCSPIKKSSK